MAVKPIPDGYHTITPYLIVNDGAAAIEFYKKAFNASERMKMEGPGGKVMHAEVVIDGSIVMLADEFPEMDIRSPSSYGGSPTGILIYVEDVNQRFNQAIEAGGKEKRPLVDQFYGDRLGTLEDPFGHVWTIASRVEELSPEEIDKRFTDAMQQESC
jgi:PhnB protein